MNNGKSPTWAVYFFPDVKNLFLKQLYLKINIAKLQPITSVIEGKNRPRFFYLLLQIKSRPDLTNGLCILSFCPCSPFQRHAAHQLSNYSDATGGFVSNLFT
jgi:hypothetical protein